MPHITKAGPTRSVLQLPPLILHPFSGGDGSGDLLEGSVASLALQGLVASTEDESELLRRMLAGRYQELRMLVFLGKDLFRWMRQCVGHVQAASVPRERDERMIEQSFVEQSFSALVVEEPPAGVRLKVEGWGVTDRRAIFSRAIGIHSIFEEPPPARSLSAGFLKNYHRYADHAYICYQHSQPFLPLDPANFPFEIYASDEYARLLSEEWDDKQ